MKIVAALVLMGMAACAGTPAGGSSKIVTMDRIESGGQCALAGDGLQLRLYQNAESFAADYASIHVGSIPRPAPPAIDFDNHAVVAAFLGRRPTAGYGVSLGDARLAEGGRWLEVTVLTRQPPPEAITAQVITSPYYLGLVARNGWGGVRFLDGEGKVLAELPAAP